MGKHEAAAAGIIRVGKEDGDSNLADVFTKCLDRPRCYDLLSRIGYSSMFGGGKPPGKRETEDTDQPELQHMDKKMKLIHYGYAPMLGARGPFEFARDHLLPVDLLTC